MRNAWRRLAAISKPLANSTALMVGLVKEHA
jgi:hypothetical protein